MKKQSLFVRVLLAASPVLLALFFSTVMLLLAGANPLEAYGNILSGAFESTRKLADVAVAAVPLLLCAAGMLITFAAGMWNIGVEGQMVAGALMTTWLVRSINAPSYVVLPLSVLAGMLGGAVWGGLVGLLRTYGKVNEIFGGLGLNYVSIALTNYLILGPWKASQGATMSGTEPFPPAAWMPLLGSTRMSLVTLCLAVIAIVAVYFTLRDTRWGLELKATGLNAKAAQRCGVATLS